MRSIGLDAKALEDEVLAMYLKRLELQGFKSFHAKTLFEFAPGITAVVGPNGSGKSNVAESIRWVLGEQRARNVRARRLEDVIFSGSSQKAAVGMAEVSITLDNSEGWLPVDYSEVVVSRRAYRNGESEYLINKNKVRLRDVLDLFMRAQVGQNSYAFMGQGLVDEVLVMRPEERRRLLEEAADVRLLRTRLDEARDRLSATRENLERVQPAARRDRAAAEAARAPGITRGGAQPAGPRAAGDAAGALHPAVDDAQESLAAARATFDQRSRSSPFTSNEAKACEEGLTALERRQSKSGSASLALGGPTSAPFSTTAHRLDQRLSLDRERIENQTARQRRDRG